MDRAVDEIRTEGGSDAPRFEAVLSPHRSLGRSGFTLLMIFIGGVSFVVGTAFALIGAWPVFGFFGLDVLLIYLAFRINYRAGRLYETVALTETELVVRRHRPSGKVQSWSFNPYWVKLLLEKAPGRPPVMALTLHGRRLVFGSFLSEPEKKSFAKALSGALFEARGGVRI